ncbi:phage portal protein [Leclercia adecarboxylata ATCC 23216 = NBRC 102595]|nr:phage portal protein [Leclercia adecarboxylata ATCC 23216 = NBRC 102595]
MNNETLQTAFNPAAPADEQQDAMAQAQKAAMPSSVPDLSELVQHIARNHENTEFYKSLQKPSVVPFPSHAVQHGQNRGMQSVWLDERQTQMQGQYFEKPNNFNFDAMRTMVDRTPVLSAVIMTRIRQVARFCRANASGLGPGFSVTPKGLTGKMSEATRKEMAAMNMFFMNCGFESNPRQRQRLGRDSFSGFMGKIIRDSLVMDSAPIETEYKSKRALGMDGFYAVDGATIRLCNEDGYEGDDEIFALQVVQGNIRTAYTYNDLIYVPRNERSDVLQGGYGMSETELLVSTVTGYLNAMTYNQKYFDSNAIPKGLLHLSGDYSQDDLSSFKRYWNSMVRGINNAWTLPVMTSKNQESKASFERFGTDVNEMMFSKWMAFLTSIICAVYGMAPEEINFESFTGNASALRGNNTEEKLINSKDKGLRPLLAHFEDLFTDFIVADFNPDLEFRWTGLDEKTPQQRFEEEKMAKTFNEMRKSRGWAEIDQAWAQAPVAASGAQQAFMADHARKIAEKQQTAYAAQRPDAMEQPMPEQEIQKSFQTPAVSEEMAKAFQEMMDTYF